FRQYVFFKCGDGKAGPTSSRPRLHQKGRLLPRSYCPKPRLCLRCLRMAHDAPDYWSGPVTEPHIIVVLVPKIRPTAFPCRYQKKGLVMIHLHLRWYGSPTQTTAYWSNEFDHANSNNSRGNNYSSLRSLSIPL